MLKVVGFVEGARRNQGGAGLVGVPRIHQSLAARGHEDHLLIMGPPMPTALSHLNKHMRRELKIHVHSGITRWAFNPFVILKAAPLVRDCDFVVLHSLYSYPVLLGFFLSRLYRKQYGLWPHGVLAPFQRRVSARRKKAYGKLIADRIMDEAAILFFSAHGEYQELRELELRAPAAVVPHGVDVELFTDLPRPEVFRNKYMNGHSGPLVLFLGRINAKKGLDILVHALRRVFEAIPDAQMAIAGGGDPPGFIATVKRWIQDGGIADRIKLTGQLSDGDKLAAFAAADVFAFPSEAENFGFAMFEAMACGLPVVVSDTLNYAFEVQSSNAGVVVPRGPESFANAIIRLLKTPDMRKSMGENGRRVAERYSWEECGRKFEKTINSVVYGDNLPAEVLPNNRAPAPGV
jgi:glycosyltransferase involved in cell wall biosynthesis